MKFFKFLGILVLAVIGLTYGKKKFVFPASKSYRQKWLQPLLNKTINDIRPYGLITYISDDLGSFIGLHNSISQEISRFTTTLRVKVPKNYIIIKSNSPAKAAVMNIIFLKEDHRLNVTISKYQNILRYASFGVSTVPRPKTIIFIYGKSVYKKFESTLKKLQTESWKMKYLDATFIYIHEDFRIPPYVSSYNPFTNRFDRKLANQTTTLFSEKLRDMFGYKILFGNLLGKLHPNETRDDESDRLMPVFLIQLKESSYIFAKYFLSKAMNFTLVVNYRNNTSDIYNGMYMLEKFDDNVIVASRPNDIIYLGAAIPHLEPGELKSEYNAFNIVYYVLVVFSFTVLIRLMVKLLKFNHCRWRDYRCLSCILGMRIAVGNEVKERAFYFVIILLAFYISIDLVSIVTNMELDTNEKVVENLKDLDDMKVPIYCALPVIYDYRDDDVNERLVEKTTLALNDFEKINDCFQELDANNDRICIHETPGLNLWSALFKTYSDSKKGLRKTRFHLKTAFRIAYFGNASPFVKKFDTIILRSIEVGLIRRPVDKEILSYMKLEYDDEDYNISDYDTRIFYKSLLHILFVGLIFGACVFVCEVSYKVVMSDVLPTLHGMLEIYRNRNVNQDIEMSTVN